MSMPTRTDDSRQALPDIGASTLELQELMTRLVRVMSACAQRQWREISGEDFALVDRPSLGVAFWEFGLRWMSNPVQMWTDLSRLAGEHMQLAAEFVGDREDRAGRQRLQSDKRFSNPAWIENPANRYLAAAHRINEDWSAAVTTRVEGFDPHLQAKVRFFTRQFMSAIAPSNSPLANPQVARRSSEENGANLMRGLRHLVEDLERSDGRFAPNMTQAADFKVGRNLAITPGKIIYRNDLMEIIHYEPTTDKQYARPLVIVPPWINKYYIFDLKPENSFIRYALDQGHAVFLLSWVNPDARHAGKGFDHYMQEGPLTAIDVISRITGAKKVNMLGFCIGGILTAAMLAWLAGSADNPIASATLLASMVDLTDAGEIMVFVDEHQIRSLERHAAGDGYLDGHYLADMFSMLREKDLIWSFVVNNYLMGRDPPPFDLLFWNSDTTRLPGKMLSWYLRKIYLENGLVQPGALEMSSRKLDLTRVTTPTFSVATKEDHISPWRACYAVTQQFVGPVTFVLGGSGHIAGIINPPAKKKYGYWVGASYPDDADRWLAQAEKKEGSWWPLWAKWMEQHGGDKNALYRPCAGGVNSLGEAPGTYVLG
jgi:polyhydroxyalkanoate synthase subunit PhaC